MDLKLFDTVADLAKSGYLFRIADNGGATFDRYTVVFCDGDYLGLSFNPSSPQGFSQWGEGLDVAGLAERIEEGEQVDLALGDLGEAMQRHILYCVNVGFRDYLQGLTDAAPTSRDDVEPYEGVNSEKNHVYKSPEGFRYRDDEHGDSDPYATAAEAVRACLPEDYGLTGPEYFSDIDVSSLDADPERLAAVAALEAKTAEADA